MQKSVKHKAFLYAGTVIFSTALSYTLLHKISNIKQKTQQALAKAKAYCVFIRLIVYKLFSGFFIRFFLFLSAFGSHSNDDNNYNQRNHQQASYYKEISAVLQCVDKAVYWVTAI